MKITICGDANPNGNIALTYRGGCKQELVIEDSYRCTGCDGWFHKECLIRHFKLEKEHDWGRNEERKLMIIEMEGKLKLVETPISPAIVRIKQDIVYMTLEEWADIKDRIMGAEHQNKCNCLCHYRRKPTKEEYLLSSYYGCSHCRNEKKTKKEI